MSHTTKNRSLMSVFSKARSRAYAAAALAIGAAAVGCNKDAITQVTDPDIFNVADYNTPAGAKPLRIGAIANCIAETLVSRSSITRWIETFITVESRTITNWPEQSAISTAHLNRAMERKSKANCRA